MGETYDTTIPGYQSPDIYPNSSYPQCPNPGSRRTGGGLVEDACRVRRRFNLRKLYNRLLLQIWSMFEVYVEIFRSSGYSFSVRMLDCTLVICINDGGSGICPCF